MDGWAHDNTADDWKTVMNNDYVITLDKMPGWSAYTVGNCIPPHNNVAKRSMVNVANGKLFVTAIAENCIVELFNVQGKKILRNMISTYVPLDISMLAAGTYFVKLHISNTSVISENIILR